MALPPGLNQKVAALLESALKLDPAERASFLDRACAGNSALRQEIESQLPAQPNTATFDPSSRHSKSQPEPSLFVGETIAHYKILSFLGRGGMGEVYLAQDSRLGRKVALKLLPKSLSHDEERLRRFEREARSASALSHPNVCVIHEIGETADGRPYISMEYIDGETLRKRFARGRFKLSEAIDIARQTASALAAAHEAGVVHRDIKPENIMLRRDGYVKVLDFGLAKLTERYEAGSDSEAPTFHIFSTHSGAILGTTSYLSPEQARRLTVDERGDIWALGVVLYEMIAGRLPFTGETPSHIVVSILESDPEPLTRFLPGVPPELEWVVRKALRKDRESRYQTVKELLGDLEDVRSKIADSTASGDVPVQDELRLETISRHSSALESLSHTLRRPRLSIAWLVALLLFVGVTGWFVVERLRNKSPQLQNVQYIKLTNSGNITDAAISPDGKYVAYVVDDLGKQSLWTRHVPTASNVMVAPPDEVRYDGVTFSPDGNYIFYVREEKDQVGTLYQVSVVGGSTTKLLRGIDSAVTFSPDGTRIAFYRLDHDAYKIIVSNADSSNPHEIISDSKSVGFTYPSWSPDNRSVAYGVASYTGGYHMNLVMTPIAGGAEQPITAQSWYSIRRVSWLSDNTGLIISASEQPYGVFQLWRVAYPSGTAERITNELNDHRALGITSDDTLVTVRADKSTNIWLVPINDLGRARKLVPEVGNYFGVSWFQDGRIAFSSMASGNPDIWVINSDGTGLKQITSNSGSNYHPAVSPDGRYIAFTGYRSGVFNIWRMDADGSNQIRLTSGDGASFPAWSADGKWIYYDVLAAENATLWKVGVDGGDPQSVVNRHWSRGAVISPDGRLITCTYRADESSPMQYAVIPSEGGTPIKLFGNPDPRVRMVRWMPDNKGMMYVDSHDGNLNIWSESLSSSSPKQITAYDSDQVFDFDVSRDGKQLVLTRGTTVSDVVLIRGFKGSR